MVVDMKECFIKGKNMGKVDLIGHRDLVMLESIKIILYKERDYIYGLMVENIMENGKIIKWRDMENLHGLMAKNIMEIMSQIKNKDLEHLSGLVAKNMLENGLMENNMEKVLTIAPEEHLKMGNGERVKEFPGLIKAKNIMITDTYLILNFFEFTVLCLHLNNM